MNPLPLALSVGFLVSLSCGLIYWGLPRLRRDESPQQRLERLSASPHPLDQADLEMPFSSRVLMPWLRRQIRAAGRLAPSRNIEKIRQDLIQAGHPSGLTVLDFLGIKLLAGLLVGGAVLYLTLLRGGRSFFAGVLFTVAVGAVAFLLPDFWLGSRVRQRQAEIRKTLPDALDMLTICVDAGAGLGSAMLKISQKWKNAIAFEFGKVVAEMNIGLSRRVALQNMAERAGVAEVHAFVAVLIQADQFGLSIAKVLHTQSDEMRNRRWQRAEEESRKVPIKLLFPMVFLLLPAMLGITVGPTIPILLGFFRMMGQ